MKHYPASRHPAQISGIEHHHATHLYQRSRAFWFAMGFFSALTVAGFVAGLFHWPN